MGRCLRRPTAGRQSNALVTPIETMSVIRNTVSLMGRATAWLSGSMRGGNDELYFTRDRRASQMIVGSDGKPALGRRCRFVVEFSAMAADMDSSSPSNSINRVTRRLAELRWPIVIIVVGAAAVHQALLFALLRLFPAAQQEWIHLAVYSVTGVVVVWLGLRALLRTATRQEQAEASLHAAYADLAQTHRQLQTIHEVGRRVTNSSDVQELLEIAARIPVELLGAASASVITFDAERARSTLEMTYGLDAAAVQALRQQTETAHSPQQCANCQPLTAHVNAECHLLASLQTSGNRADLDRIVCMPLGRGDVRSGVVSAYLQPGVQPSQEQIHLVSILATEVSGALEAARLRARQMATLYAVDQATQERRSLDNLLSRVLETTIDGWGVQAGAILLAAGDSWDIRAQRGMGHDLAEPAFGLALRLAERARATGQADLFPGTGQRRHLHLRGRAALAGRGGDAGRALPGQPGAGRVQAGPDRADEGHRQPDCPGRAQRPALQPVAPDGRAGGALPPVTRDARRRGPDPGLPGHAGRAHRGHGGARRDRAGCRPS